MKRAEYEAWAAENVVAQTTEWINGIHYIFATLKDGWIGILETNNFGVYPKIQAADMEHARSWCAMIEPVTVPIDEFVPRKEV